MKSIFILGLIVVLDSVVFAANPELMVASSGNAIQISVRFPKPRFLRAPGKTIVRIDGLLNTVEGGLPSIPVKTVKIALPPGDLLSGFQWLEGNPVRFAEKIAPASGVAPISWMKNQRRLPEVPAPHFSGDEYPSSRVQLDLQRYHGVAIALVSIYPIVVTRSGEADFIDNIKVRLNLSPRSPQDNIRIPSLQKRERIQVSAFVDNPSTLDLYPVTNARAEYDYLILSTEKMIAYQGANGLGDLQKGLLDRGLRSKVVDVATVAASALGADLAEKIRGFIRSEYTTHGISYVLLAGRSVPSDSETFLPSRPLWSKIRAYLGYWFDLEEIIPADIYYACLDGSFNSNGDTKWGEPADGENGSDVDFLAEVMVGRAVLNSVEQLQNFVRKTLWSYNHPFSRQVLLLGEALFSELHLYGDDYMNQLLGQCTDHGYETTGYPSDWKAVTLYDRVKPWGGQAVFSEVLGNTFSMINHLGHSNENYNMRMGSSDIAQFKNENPFIYYTQGCLAGKFTVGSFVDKMVSASYAAVVAVGNSSFGLAPEDPTPSTTTTPGASQMLHRKFVDAILGKEVKQLGRAHQMSKEAFIDLKSAQEVRWVNWSTTYFGDPSLEMGL